MAIFRKRNLHKMFFGDFATKKKKRNNSNLNEKLIAQFYTSCIVVENLVICIVIIF